MYCPVPFVVFLGYQDQKGYNMSTTYTLVAPCFFGTESTLSFEIKRLGAENVKVTDGRVSFEGGADLIAAANLNLRTAERVLLLLKTYTALTFDELFDGVYDIPWEELIPADAQFPVKGSSLSSQLSSVPACQSIVKKGDCETAAMGTQNLCAARNRGAV